MNLLLKQAFEKAAESNYWSDADSLSGPGSNMVQTRIIRERLPVLLEKYEVKSILDAPCGDLFWMKTLLPLFAEKKIQYHGADIVAGIIEKNRSNFAASNAVFYTVDLTSGPIPKVDLVFTRDCFIHLSYYNIYLILRNYKFSGARYLLTNTYTNASRRNVNVDGMLLYGRFLNMQKFPFYFPSPLDLLVEGCTENEGINADKSLGLWDIQQLNLVKIKLVLCALFIPETAVKMCNGTMHFLKRVKRFLWKKIWM